jgi:hypothetical protein
MTTYRKRTREQERIAKRKQRAKKKHRKTLTAWIAWHMQGAARKAKQPPLPCPRCERDWRIDEREWALPPETFCPPCEREIKHTREMWAKVKRTAQSAATRFVRGTVVTERDAPPPGPKTTAKWLRRKRP